MTSKYTQLSPVVWVRDIEWGKERFRGEGRLEKSDPYSRTFRSRCRLELTDGKLDVHAEYPFRDVVLKGDWEYPALGVLLRYSGKKSDGSRGSLECSKEYLGTLHVKIELQGDIKDLSDCAREKLFDKAYKHFCLSTLRSRVFRWRYLLKRCFFPLLYWVLSFPLGLSNEDISLRDRMDNAKKRMFSSYRKGTEDPPERKNLPPSKWKESGPFSLSTPAMLTLALIYGLLWVREAPPYTLSAVFFSRDNKGVPLPLDTPWLILAGLLHILLGNRVVTLLFRGLNPSDTLHITLKV